MSAPRNLFRNAPARLWADRWSASVLGALPALVALGLVALVGGRLAIWTTRWVPEPQNGIAASISTTAASATATAWFGSYSAPVVAATPSADPATPDASGEEAIGDLRLLGVLAGGTRSIAMLQAGKTRYEVAVGEKFAEQWTLKAVAAEFVTLQNATRTHKLRLPSSPAPGPAVTATAPPPAFNNAVTPTAGGNTAPSPAAALAPSPEATPSGEAVSPRSRSRR